MSVEKEQILMRIIEVEESISRLTETVRGLLRNLSIGDCRFSSRFGWLAD